MLFQRLNLTRTTIRNYRDAFISAILAGIFIGIGCAMFLKIENKFYGSILFCIGIISVVVFKVQLFTGKAGYLYNKHKEERYPLSKLILVWFGNLVGMIFMTLMMRFTNYNDAVHEAAVIATQNRLNLTMYSAFIMSILCGMLMYLSVQSFKLSKSYLALCVPIVVFINVGAEHCIANMFFFFMSGIDIATWLPCLLVMSVGNIIGSLIISVLESFSE